MERFDSESFYDTQGLLNDTAVDLDKSTFYMYEYIAIFIGPPIKAVKRITHIDATLKRVSVL